MKAAALNTKLNYIHAEAQQKTKLMKIRTLKELDIAQSKISALEGLEGATACPATWKNDIPKIDMVDMYLKNQQDEQVKTESVDTNVYIHVPTVQPSTKYRPESLSKTSVPKILPATSVRLNPTAPEWNTDNTGSVHPSGNNVTQRAQPRCDNQHSDATSEQHP